MLVKVKKSVTSLPLSLAMDVNWKFPGAIVEALESFIRNDQIKTWDIAEGCEETNLNSPCYTGGVGLSHISYKKHSVLGSGPVEKTAKVLRKALPTWGRLSHAMAARRLTWRGQLCWDARNGGRLDLEERKAIELLPRPNDADDRFNEFDDFGRRIDCYDQLIAAHLHIAIYHLDLPI